MSSFFLIFKYFKLWILFDQNNKFEILKVYTDMTQRYRCQKNFSWWQRLNSFDPLFLKNVLLFYKIRVECNVILSKIPKDATARRRNVNGLICLYILKRKLSYVSCSFLKNLENLPSSSQNRTGVRLNLSWRNQPLFICIMYPIL